MQVCRVAFLFWLPEFSQLAKCINTYFHGQLFSTRKTPKKWIPTFWICFLPSGRLCPDWGLPWQRILCPQVSYRLSLPVSSCSSYGTIVEVLHRLTSFFSCARGFPRQSWKAISPALWDTMPWVLWGVVAHRPCHWAQGERSCHLNCNLLHLVDCFLGCGAMGKMMDSSTPGCPNMWKRT